jgi:hypothetical protein
MKPIDPDQVFHFIKLYGTAKLKAWPDGTLKLYIAHHIRYAQMSVIYQLDGSIIGVGVARVINRRKTEHIRDYWRVSEEGNTIYMTLGIARHPVVLARLFYQMVKRFGPRKWIMDRRHGKLHRWDFNTFMDRISILNKAQPALE